MFALPKLAGPIILGVAALVAISYFAYHFTQQGAEAERQKQEKENAQFQVKAKAGAVSYDVCDAAGGMYDFRKGTCKLPATR